MQLAFPSRYSFLHVPFSLLLPVRCCPGAEQDVGEREGGGALQAAAGGRGGGKIPQVAQPRPSSLTHTDCMQLSLPGRVVSMHAARGEVVLRNPRQTSRQSAEATRCFTFDAVYDWKYVYIITPTNNALV